MNKDGQEELTAEQFRSRLYCLFEKRGVVDYLKTQMRHLLVEELQECVPGGNILKKKASATATAAAEDDNTLLLRAANSLVANHLQKCEYEYTMGIFIPESGTYPDKAFSTADLLQLLHINPSSELYKRLVSQFASYTKKGFLWQLLCELSSLYSSATVSTSVQTDFMPQYSLSTLDEKLNGVERMYRSKKEKHNQNAMLGLEEKLVSLQRQLEERYETELQLELTRMKENDLVKFRMEEKERCRKELELSKRELEKNYQIRLNSLRERERNFTERLQKEEEMQLKETYIQRQSLLEEINALRERDTGITRTLEGINREKSLHEEKMRSQEELLRQKLNEVNRMEMEYHQRLQNEISKFKIEEQKKFLERCQNLDKRESQVNAAELRISEDQRKMQSLKEELQNQNIKIHELEILLQEARRNEITLMMDLNEKNCVSRREFESEKIQHSETIQLNECLQTRQETFMKESRQLNQEMARVKQEMEMMRNELNQEKILYENYKQKLDERLHKEITQNRKLLQQCEEQTQEMKTQHQEMSEVQYRLLVAQEGYSRKPKKGFLQGPTKKSPANEELSPAKRPLNNEITKKKKRIYSRSLSNHRIHNECAHRPTQKIKTRSIYKCLCSDDSCDDISSCRSHSLVQRICQDAGRLSDEELTNEESSNIIAEIKYEKKMLEEQMKNVQHGYRCFQNRLMRGASPPARTSLAEETAHTNVLKTSKKKLEYSTGGPRDVSPVPIPNSGSRSSKTLSSTPCKDSKHSADKQGHSISALPRFDISQLTGEDENRSIDEGSPVAAIISELSKTKGEEKKVDKAKNQRDVNPSKPSSATLPTKPAKESKGLIPDVSQTVLSPLHTSLPSSSSAFVPISTPFSTLAIAQSSTLAPISSFAPISASPHLISTALPPLSAPFPLSANSVSSASISAPLSVTSPPPASTSPLAASISPLAASTSPPPASTFLPVSAPLSVTAPPPTSTFLPVSAPLSVTAPPPTSTFLPVSAPLSVTAPPPTSTFLPVSAPLSVTAPHPTSTFLPVSAPLSVTAPHPDSTSPPPPVSALPPHSQLSPHAPTYSEKFSLESLAATNPTSLEHDLLPINPTAIQPPPVVSLDDAWGFNKKSEHSSYQSKSSSAEVLVQQKHVEQEMSPKTHPEQDDIPSDATSSHSIPGFPESSAKEEKDAQNLILNKEDSSQIETEIESDILPDSGSARSSPALDLGSQKKSAEPTSTEDKPKLVESEPEEIHSESLSQSHMSDSEVDDMFENW